MVGRRMNPQSLLCVAALIAAPACWAQKPDGISATHAGPGAGYGVNEEGLIDPGGATQLNIPIGYTPSDGQVGLSLWGADAGGAGANLEAGLTLGLFEPGQALSVTGVLTDTSQLVTAHAQKQLIQETTRFPAISAGVMDIADEFERSYWVAATKRLGPAPQFKATYLTAAVPAWPAWPGRPSLRWPPSWGALVLPGQGKGSATGRAARNELLVPRSDVLPALDGMLGKEWLDAAQAKLLLPRGEQFLVGVKVVGQVLYVALAVPSDRPIAPGASAEICFEVPRATSHILCNKHTKYRLEWAGGKEPTRLYAAVPVKGRWVQGAAVTGAALHQQGVTGACGDAGDGVWRYPVFEFAIPIEELKGADPGDRVGFAAVVTLPRLISRKPLVAKDKDIEALRWPVPRRTDLMPSQGAFEKSPDFWGEVLFRGKSSGPERISAPEVGKAPTLDGEVGESEWAAADKRTTGSVTGAEQTVYAQRTDEAVYLAVVATALDGPRRHQDLMVFLDPMGDGGLQPRPDDRVVRFVQSDTDTKVELHSWNEKLKKWMPTKAPFCEVVVKPAEVLEGTMTVAEIEIPLKSLRMAHAPGSNQKMGMALETELKPAPPRTTPRPRRESAAGDSTYVTVAWGSGMYHHRFMYGVSTPIGAYRAMAEYDGDQVNVGVTGGLFGSERIRFTVGWNGLNTTRDSGPMVGTAVTTRF